MKVKLLNLNPNSEKLIEIAGRTSYLSFDKQKPGSEKKFIKMIIKQNIFSCCLLIFIISSPLS